MRNLGRILRGYGRCGNLTLPAVEIFGRLTGLSVGSQDFRPAGGAFGRQSRPSVGGKHFYSAGKIPV